ncbi:MAG: hypothetical protein NC311_12605 [Muribaculaceae bacterium]|nr:hypothetical protein [Muribaculaceae bacterium]MCM1439668.1 hypothetical protein [Roseburia sp.]
MEREAHITDQQFQYIARISHGKDSMKMLDVIFTRGLPLDRITTTDIWATDTIRGEHPKMVAFKERADEYIWRKYHIEVEHLCAMKGGQKVTYEKLFYHVPKRKAKNCGGGGITNRGLSWASRTCGIRGASQASNEQPSTRIQGFPAQIGSWCKKLKIDYIKQGADTQALVCRGQHQRLPRQLHEKRDMVPGPQNKGVFTKSRHEGR